MRNQEQYAPMESGLMDLQALRSSDSRLSALEWAKAYPLLWEAGMRIARLRLVGAEFEQDREDTVSVAVQQFIRGMISSETDSFNQLADWNDCLGMVRHIVRLRVTDFLRGRGRRREDAVEELPEFPLEVQPSCPFTSVELLREVDLLEPNPPVPQVFRDRFLEGRSTDEIAVERGINRNTLCSYYAKGLRTLRERLSRLEGGWK
jgi:hypothetical protein